GTLQESIRLAEHVPLLMDINSKLVFGRGYNTAHLTAQHPPQASGGVSYQENYNERQPRQIAGWRTGPPRPAPPSLVFPVVVVCCAARLTRNPAWSGVETSCGWSCLW
ncbi:DUF7373 family lipoprotein, partial [Nocardia farcinica]|uniref:DUF7373 family lipoprotein n=1 Tax=Nocardia farcinica TaxID=37329 RepID=UPI002455478C